MSSNDRKDCVGIFVGGGPAPGINGVIAAATIEARNRGWRVVGIYDGLRWLAEGRIDQTINLRIRDISRIHRLGGSILRISRRGNVYDPEERDRVLDSLRRLGVGALLAIGGDGTASAAAELTKADPELTVVHVPKTIDNDLPLPGGFSTFGFQTARHIGVEVVQRLMEDARTTGRWYLVITMGRDAGHLALGIGKAAGATMTLIPEEFDAERITLDDLTLPIEGAMIRRMADGRRDGVVVLAEGLAKKLDPAELVREDLVERTLRGDLRLSNLPLGNVLRHRLLQTLGARGMDPSITTKVIGYELRCADPIPFDTEYTRELGYGAMQAILRERGDGIVCRHGGKIHLHPFAEFRDPVSGRVRVRFVDTKAEPFQVALRYQLRLRKRDLESGERRQELAKLAHLEEEEFVKRFSHIAIEDLELEE